MKCPPLHNLLDYSRHLLAETDAAAVKEHLLDGCGKCSENLRWIADALGLTARHRPVDLPEETIRSIVAWFKSQPAPASRTVRKLIANLIFDSLMPGQLSFVREETPAGQPPAGRQMLFQAEGYDVDLRFEGVEDKTTEDLIGQILPNGEARSITAGVTVQLWREEQEQMQAQADEQGLFSFRRIPSGVYDLKIQVAEGEINLVRVSTARAV
ncbi:MAG: hypothetical protein AB7P14_18100 [Blastocatellales bacterium]